MANVGIISIDGHVKAPWQTYPEYLDPAWREAYDGWMQATSARPDFCHPDLGPDAQWTPAKRVAALEEQGVVAEVAFPNGTPFADSASAIEATRAGNTAYNRWLADACADAPGRMFGSWALTPKALKVALTP